MLGFSQAVNFIITIVLAVLILSFGVTWLGGLFSSIQELTTQVTDVAKAKLIEDLQKSNDKVNFNTPDKVVVSRGKNYQFAAGLKNVRNEDTCFLVKMDLGSAGSEVLNAYGCSDFGSCTELHSDVNGWVGGIEVVPIGSITSDNNVGVRLIDVGVPNDAKTGRYFFQIQPWYGRINLVDCTPTTDRSRFANREGYIPPKQIEIEVK